MGDQSSGGGDAADGPDGGGDDVDFEEAVDRLEGIVEDLEAGRAAESDLDLDRALELYEEGVGLVRACRDRLDDAEQRLETLDVDHDVEDGGAGGAASGDDDRDDGDGREPTGRGADAGPNDTLGGTE